MRIVIFGSTSFAARGLVEHLECAGCEVITFRRGPSGFKNAVLNGSLASVDQLAPMVGSIDCIINYAVIKDSDIQDNIEALRGILRFAKATGAKRLLHISSISVYDTSVPVVREGSPIAKDPMSKGAYASLKIAADQFLHEQSEYPGIKIALIRPGFVLGAGIANPFPGIGVRLPINRLLLFGSGRVQIPLVTRDYLNQLVEKVAFLEDLRNGDVFHAFDPGSPTRKSYLQACNEILGVAKTVWGFPAFLWYMLGGSVDLLLRVIGKGPKILRSVRNSCSRQVFDAAITEKRLRMAEKVNLKAVLLDIMDGQVPRMELPNQPDVQVRQPGRMGYLGSGRIVRTAHLDAVRRLNWDSSQISFYDLGERKEPFGKVRDLRLKKPSGKGFWIVATPAVAHIHAIEDLSNCSGTVLIEKPLALDQDQFGRWKTLADSGLTVGACHNYRFKRNMLRFRKFLNRYPSGRLLGANLLFQSPPVANDDSPWIRNERKSRSLLMDYSIHFMDVACTFSKREWKIDCVDYRRNQIGETSMIRGQISCQDYPVNFHLQQGFGPRTCRVEFVFQNYTAVISFFPDSCYVRMSNEGAGTGLISTTEISLATLAKIKEKLSGISSDGSHLYCYSSLINDGKQSEISITSLDAFYKIMFELSERIYGKNEH